MKEYEIDEVRQIVAIYFKKHKKERTLDLESRHILMRKLYPDTSDIYTQLEQVEDLKRCLYSFFPLPQKQAIQIDNHFENIYTYESNRIESNILNLYEVMDLLNNDKVSPNKPFSDHMEIFYHKKAIHFVKDLVYSRQKLTKNKLILINRLFLRDVEMNEEQLYDPNSAYRHKDIDIKGWDYIPPSALELPPIMNRYFSFYEENKNVLHPILLAAEMHGKLVLIHPFDDGNGRTARLVMNMIMLQHGYPFVIISGDMDSRLEYYKNLDEIRTGSTGMEQFILYIIKKAKESISDYIDAIIENDLTFGKGDYFYRRIAGVF